MSDSNLSRIENERPSSEVVQNKDSPYYVVLPCEVKDFRSFVSGLLGKPQELRGEIEGTFRIGHPQISNLYHLLEQRMAKQNDASLVHFAITIYYDDGHSVVHNNVADFERYHPTAPCHPTAAVISATYLIKFRGHDSPEKQEIEVVFAKDPQYKDRGNGPRWFSGALFEYRILHTERTWATDIAGLITNHASTVLSKLTGLRKFFHRYMDELVIYGSIAVFLLSVFAWTTAALSLIRPLNLGDASQIRGLLEFCIRSVGAFAVLGCTMYVLKTYVDSTSFYRRISFISLTEHDQEHLKELEKGQFFGFLRYCGVWFVSLASGVISNVLYSKNWFW